MKIPSKAEMRARADARLSDPAKAQQTIVHEALGSYMATWSNVESLLIGLLGGLLNTSIDNAAVLYAGLFSVSARSRTIVALAQVNLEPEKAQAVARLMSSFETETNIRNSLAHAEYMLSPDGHYLSTVHYDLKRLSKEQPLMEQRPLDQERLNSLGDSRRRLMAIYDDLAALHLEWQATRGK